MPIFETPEAVSLTLELGVGEVRIVASDRDDTVVEVQPSDPAKKSDVAAARQTSVEYANGTVLVKAPKGWRQWTPWGGHESIDVLIELPEGSAVRGVAGVAALRCTGRIGECRYRTGVGDIALEHTGPVELKAGSGDVTVDVIGGSAEIRTAGAVRIGRIDGSAVIKNSNGDTRIGEVAGEARVNAANGAISIDLAHSSVAAKTANGNVRLGEVARGRVVAQSAFGRVEIGVPDGVPAWLDLETRFGHVQNDLDVAERPEPNEDAVEVHAHTSMGDITIHRSYASSIGTDEP
jgi:Putative adhesin